MTRAQTAQTAQAHSTRTTLDAFLDRFGSGDIPGVLALFAGTVDFRVDGSPNVPWTGTRSRPDQIAAFFALLPTVLTPPESFTVHTRVVDGHDAVLTAHGVFGVLATGKKFTNRYALHLRVEDGLITRYHMYEDSHAIARAFAD
ncbi:nuclear transport factor 2 family protein [Streptomyces sp. NBC_01506]|uniref:nuclear transport factor 2 family protein n=1 Tax=Streptomyces sp. NBC_01506 TaxID=2903887 RepID=UPI00386CF454